MPDRYEIIDHTADIAIKASGKNLEEAFENAAYAMFDIMADASSVKAVGEMAVEIEADDLGRLLVDWLSELLYICDVDDLLFSEFEVNISGNRLTSKAKGEKMDASRHGLKTDIKAVTYHMLEVNPDENFVQVLFDI
jgi:SHS2 domain-containing protein